jgi:phospholipid/cholesterol/gamma-HCH transport system substrate-binding protein
MEHSEKLKLTVGLFIVISVILFVIIMLWLSASNFYKKGQYFLTYFDESIQGLEVASPVKYRGIIVGRVAKIDIAQNSRYIEVLMEIDSNFLVQKNIIAQLKSVGITGFIYIELNLYDKEKKSKLLIPDFTTNFDVIPSIPSDLGQIMEILSEIAFEFRSMRLSEIATKMKEILEHINDKLKDVNAEEIQYNIKNSLEQITKSAKALEIRLNQSGTLINNANSFILKNNKNFNSLLQEFRQTATNLNNLIDNANNIITNNKVQLDNLPEKVNYIVLEVGKSIEKLNEILGKIEDKTSIIFSQPPSRRRFKK